MSERGGADWHLRGVIEAQRNAGHDPILAFGDADPDVRPPCEIVPVPALAAADRRPASGALEALHRGLEPEAVHVHNVMNPDALEWAAGKGAVATVQDHRGFCPGRGKWTEDGRVCDEGFGREVCRGCFSDEVYFRRILELTSQRRDALASMAAVTVLSRYMADELVAAGLEARRIHVIPPFVHGLDPGARASGPACVLFVGRLVSAKGPLDALEAWRSSGVELPLVFAGTGSLRAEIEAQGGEVLGWVPHADLSAVYRRARALVMAPRWQEPFGIVGLEALFMGIPVVTWESGGIREWLRDDTPVPYGDTSALGAALRRAVATHPGPLTGFDAKLQMDRLEAVYRAACP